MSLLDRDHLENNLLNRIEKLAADIEQLERFVPSPVGEIPDNIAYFQPVTGDLNAPGDINVIGDVRVEGFLNLGTATELTIASGAVTATRTIIPSTLRATARLTTWTPSAAESRATSWSFVRSTTPGRLWPRTRRATSSFRATSPWTTARTR